MELGMDADGPLDPHLPLAPGLIETRPAKLQSIRWGFVRLLALLLTIALVSTGLLIWSVYDFAQNRTKRQLLDTTRALTSVVDGEFARYETILRTLAESPSFARGDWPAVDREAQGALQGTEDSIVLEDISGRQLVDTSLRPGARSSDLPAKINRPPMIEKKVTYVCRGREGSIDRRGICLNLPVLRDGVVAYVLSISLRPSAMATVVARQQLPESWRAVLLDNRDRLIWRNRPSRGGRSQQALVALKTSDEGVALGRTRVGVPFYIAFSRSPVSRWSFMLSVPRAEFEAQILPALVAGVGVVGLLMAIGAAIAFVWMRRFSRAIDVLATGAAALARQDAYDPPRTRIQELQDIAGAMAEAARTLHRRDEDLNSLNASLSERVDAAVSERKIALEQLHEARKLETLGQLTGGVAHDFNNLLSPIMGSLEMLQIRLAGDERCVRLIDGALASSERAKLLVARLLSFARRQALRPRAVDVSGLVMDIVDLMRHSLGSSIKVTIDPGVDVASAYVDPNQLELALLNIAINARDAMSSGGTLALVVRQIRPGEGDPAMPDGQYVRISMTDTGTGMDEITRQRAVEPFFTTKKPGQGTGLGLSMVHGLAAQSRGAFTLFSELGQGTRADIWLPVSEAHVQARPRRSSPKEADRILLVDDDDPVRNGTAEMLLDMGFLVTDTASAIEALEIVRSGAVIFCLVTDYRMPGMNGAELVDMARQVVPGLPVVLMTGFAGQDIDIGSIEYLEKPFRQKHLGAAIAAATGIPLPQA